MSLKDEGNFCVFSKGRLWHGVSENLRQNKNKTSQRKAKNIQDCEIFEKMKSYTIDSYWLEILANAAEGRLPQKIKIDTDQLVLKNTNKIYTLKLPLDNPEEAFNIFKDFLQTHLAFFSPEENLSQIKPNVDNEKKIKFWKDVKALSLKDQLIQEYISYIADSLKLKSFQTLQLSSVIRMGFSAGYFRNENVFMHSGLIRYIEFLELDENTGEFYIDTENCLKIFKNTRTRKNKNKSTETTTGITAEEFEEGQGYSGKYALTKAWEKLLKSRNQTIVLE